MTTDVIGHVESVTGEVFVTHATVELAGKAVAAAREQLTEGAPVYQGDLVETGPASSIAIVFIDDTTFSLGEDAGMVLDELIFDPATQEGSLVFSALQGAFVFASGEIAANHPENMTIKTPVATIGIRGTKAACHIKLGEDDSICTVFEGAIIITNGGGTVILDLSNQSTRIASFVTSPGVPFIMTSEDLQDFFGPAFDPLFERFGDLSPEAGSQGRGQGGTFRASGTVGGGSSGAGQGGSGDDEDEDDDDGFPGSGVGPSSGVGAGFFGFGAPTDLPDVTIDGTPDPGTGISDVSVTEGETAVFTVTLSAPTDEAVTVTFSTADGTAISGGSGVGEDDYGATSGTVIIPAGSTSATIAITTNQDDVFEGTETALVNLGAVTSGNAVILDTQGEVTILDDDGPPDVSIGDAEAPEGDPLVFTVSLSNPSTEAIVLDLAAGLPGTATPVGDYETAGFEYSSDGGGTWTAATNGTEVTIPAGSTEILVRVDSAEDLIDEPNETFTLSVDGVVSGTVGDTSDVGTGTILDDDGPPDVSIGDAEAPEGDPLVFTVSLSNPSTEAIVLDLAAGLPGTATAVDDYETAGFEYSSDGGGTWTAATNGTEVTIPAGSTEILVRVDSAEDLIDEPNETFTLSVDGVVSGTVGDTSDVGTGTILDDDAPPDVTIGDAEASEGEPLVFTVSLSNPSTEAIVLDLAAGLPGTATPVGDYETASFRVSTDGVSFVAAGGPGGTQVTFAAGQTQLFVEVDSAEDLIDEPNETFTLSVDSVISGTVGDTSDVGTGTILDDDAAPDVTIGDAEAVEGAPLVFTVSLTNPSTEAIVLDLAAGLPGTATPVGDYETASFRVSTDGVSFVAAGGPGGTQVTFAAGQTQLFVEVDSVGNLVDDPNETFTLSVDSVVSGTVGDTSDVGTGTIFDDDGLPNVFIGNAEASEGDPLVFTVSLTNPSAGAVVLDLASVAGSAAAGVDFETAGFEYSSDGGTSWTAATNGTEVTIAAGSTQILVRVDSVSDDIIEDNESFTLEVDSVVSGTVDDTSDVGTGTILDDDADNVLWSLTGPASVAEGAGGAPEYEVGYSGVTLAPGQEISIDLDITLLGGAGEAEGADFVAAFLADLDGALPSGVSRSGNTLTFDSTAPSSFSFVLLTVDDTILEGNEDFSLAISSPSAGSIDGTGVVETTILDDDAGDVLWSLTGPASVAEGAGGAPEYEVGYSGVTLAPGQEISIDLDITLPGGAGGAEAADFAAAFLTDLDGALPSGVSRSGNTLTFDSTAPSSFSFVLLTFDDTILEGNEDFSLAISSPSAGSIDGTGVVETTILDNDAGDVLWSLTGPASVAEGAGGAPEYEIGYSGVTLAPGQEISIDLDITLPGGAGGAEAADFAAAFLSDLDGALPSGVTRSGNTLTFDSTAPSSFSFVLLTFDDTIFEGNEDFSLAISSPSAGSIDGTGVVETTILENDPEPAPDVLTQGHLQTSTNAAVQVVQVTVTRDVDGPPGINDDATLDDEAFEENTLVFSDSLVFDPDDTYTVTVEHVSGSNVDVQGLTLADATDTVLATVNPFGNDDLDFAIGTSGNAYDGGIYILEGNGTDFDLVPPVGYDFDGTTLQLETTRSGDNAFALDLGDLVVAAFEGAVAKIDISGNFTGGDPSDEDNSLSLTAQDVLDITDSGDTLTILGGTGDEVDLVDQDGGGGDEWTLDSSAGGFDTWVYGNGATIATVIIDDDADVTANLIV